MSEPTQNYQNHVRYHPPFHFVLTPLVFLNLIWSLVSLYRDPGWETGQGVLIAFILIIVGLIARTSALKAQDRIIRLEEKLRYQSLLPADLAKRAEVLRQGQIVALRFASDEELPDLVQQTLEGKFATPKDIKLAIKNWRGDYLRV